MSEPMDEHQIEEILKKLQALRADAGVLVRSKNVVMATVRKDFSNRQEKVERSRYPVPFILPLRRKYMPIIAIILAVMLGGGGTVAAAQNDIPGDPLYGVKLASEVIVAAVIPSQEAKLKFSAKRTERRGVEIVALVKKAKEAEPQKKAELSRHMQEATERLEQQAEQLEVQVAQFGQAASPAALDPITTTTEVQAQLETVQAVLAEVAGTTELSAELKSKAVGAQVVLDALQAKAAASESLVLKRHAAEVGLQGAAQGRVQAASNKLNAVTQLRARIIKNIEAEQDTERAVFMKKEFEHRDEFYRDAVDTLEKARQLLAEKEWPEAIEKANKAFKLMIQFVSPLSHEIKLHYKMKRLIKPAVDEDEEFVQSDSIPDALPANSVSQDAPQHPPSLLSPAPAQLEVISEVTRADAEAAAKQAFVMVEQFKAQLNEVVPEKVQYLTAKADANLNAGKYLEARNLYLQIMVTIKALVNVR